MSDEGIRRGVGDPTTTKVNVGPALKCIQSCGHGLVCWLIGTRLEAWHVVAKGDPRAGNGEAELLVECDAPPPTVRKRRTS